MMQKLLSMMQKLFGLPSPTSLVSEPNPPVQQQVMETVELTLVRKRDSKLQASPSPNFAYEEQK